MDKSAEERFDNSRGMKISSSNSPGKNKRPASFQPIGLKGITRSGMKSKGGDLRGVILASPQVQIDTKDKSRACSYVKLMTDKSAQRRGKICSPVKQGENQPQIIHKIEQLDARDVRRK